MKRVFCILVGLVLAGGLVNAQTTERVSVSTSGGQANGFCVKPSISADGRYVSFASSATNLVAGDTNAAWDIFVRDLLNQTTELVSVADGTNAQGHGNSSVSSIANEGHVVAFDSSAPDLVAGDLNAYGDVFVRDRTNHRTELVSLSTGGVQGNQGSGSPVISADGHFVAYISLASNLLTPLNDSNGCTDVYLRDLAHHRTERVSIASDGTEGEQQSWQPSISADGRFVAFASYATNLTADDSNTGSDVFVRDRMTHSTELVSVSIAGSVGNASSLEPSISADGRYVTFTSLATNLVAAPSSWWNNVYVRDRVAGTTTRLSVAPDGSQGNFHSVSPSVSASGRYIAFDSYATNLGPIDINGRVDIYLTDLLHSSTELVTVSSAGVQANKDSYGPLVISADGRRVVFATVASNLVVGDSNALSDVFVRDRGLLYPGTFCTAGTSTHGCVASISGFGSPSASSGSGFALTLNSVEGQKLGLIFYGLGAVASPSPWGASSSYRCVEAPVQRMPSQGSGGTHGACDGVLAIDWNAFVASHPLALGVPFHAGRHVFAQGWYRDPPSPKSTNLSNALEFVVGP